MGIFGFGIFAVLVFWPDIFFVVEKTTILFWHFRFFWHNFGPYLEFCFFGDFSNLCICWFVFLVILKTPKTQFSPV
jgi:hypothetical protein